jgi:ribosome biogenesis GTPase A
MAKIALLIGVSKYEELTPLPGAEKDIETMEIALKNPDIGAFDEVKILRNPSLDEMRMAIQILFEKRDKNDLLLLYFSGHGIIDGSGTLCLTSCRTCKDLVESSTVPAGFVHQIMNKSRSKRQVVILDCCYSAGFAKGLGIRDAGMINIQAQLGGEGRAVLTSCSAIQTSKEKDQGIYTSYLIEGLKTGTADADHDGVITVQELHEYTKQKVQATGLEMKPEIYASNQGYEIILATTSYDPLSTYRQEVEKLVGEDNGQISDCSRAFLKVWRDQLKVPPEEADAIENAVLQPFREKQEKLKNYESAFYQVIQHGSPINETNINRLKRLQKALKLEDQDIDKIHKKITQPNQVKPFLLAVLGEFKRGKTTLINALLGKDVLPSDITPCSATLTRIQYSERSFVEIEFKDGQKKEIPIEEFVNYGTKLTPESEATAAKVKEAIVHYPAAYCRNNINIIDTPGLNDDTIMNQITYSILEEVDAVIMVMMAVVSLSLSELDFIENKLFTSNLDLIIFVVTGIDRCNRPGDADKIIEHTKKNIQKCVMNRAEKKWGKNSPEYEVYLTKIGREPKVFGVSAFQALVAKQINDTNLLAQSRFPEFETALEQYIAKKRGEVYLPAAITQVIDSATKILQILNSKEETLTVNQQEVNEIRSSAKSILDNARILSDDLCTKHEKIVFE